MAIARVRRVQKVARAISDLVFVAPISLAIFFAVPHEAELLKKKLGFHWLKKEFGLFIAETHFEKKSLLIACLGMGKEAVKKNLTLLLKNYSFPQAILSGYAGALDPTLKKGSVVFSSDSLDLMASQKIKIGKIISVDQVVATAEEKQRLFQQTGASICDMEYETARNICKQHQISLHSLRVVSDTAQEDLPAGALASAYNLHTQKTTTFKLISYWLKNPKEILPFFQFVRNLSFARNQLSLCLFDILKSSRT